MGSDKQSFMSKYVRIGNKINITTKRDIKRAADSIDGNTSANIQNISITPMNQVSA